MGTYDTVTVKCPTCNKEEFFQSKSGECALEEVQLENCPDDILIDVNRHSPYTCKECDTVFKVDKEAKKSIKINN